MCVCECVCVCVCVCVCASCRQLRLLRQATSHNTTCDVLRRRKDLVKSWRSRRWYFVKQLSHCIKNGLRTVNSLTSEGILQRTLRSRNVLTG